MHFYMHSYLHKILFLKKMGVTCKEFDKLNLSTVPHAEVVEMEVDSTLL
jgi:hypothetical protein